MAIKVHYEKTAKIDPIREETQWRWSGTGSQGLPTRKNWRQRHKVIVGNTTATSHNAQLALKARLDVLPDR